MASDPFVERHLRNLPLFARLSSQQISTLARIVDVVRYEPGQLVFQQGQPTRGLILFVSGRGALTRTTARGVEEPIGWVEAGQYLNESALYSQSFESANLRAVETAIVLFIPAGRFVHLLTQIPELRANLRVQTAPEERKAAEQLFKGQREDEIVLHVMKRHWWAFARYLWTAVVAAVLMLGLALALAANAPILALVVAGLGVVVPGLIVVYLYYEWQNDSYVISDQRVIRIWNTVFTFESSLNEIPLDRVLEVSAELPRADPLSRLFRYGTLHIRTSGEKANITLDFVPDPMKVQSIVFNQRERLQQQVVEQKREAIRADIQQALGMRQQAGEDGSQKIPQLEDTSEIIGPPFLRTKYVSGNGDIVYRRHISVWLRHVFLPLLVAGVGTVIFILSLAPNFLIDGLSGLALGGVLTILSALWLYIADWDWRNDMFILGSDTITLIHKRPLWLQNQVDSVRLAQVDNVRSEVNGLINTILNRGDVHISLIGAEANAKVFDQVYDPQDIQTEVSHRLSLLKSQRARADVEQQRRQMADYLAVYHEVMGQSGGQPVQPSAPQPPQQTQQRSAARPLPPNQPTVPNQPSGYSDGIRPPRVPRSRPPQ